MKTRKTETHKDSTINTTFITEMLRENDICDLGVDGLFKDKENTDTQRQYDQFLKLPSSFLGRSGTISES